MADSSVAITAGSGTTVDTRTEATNGNHRQVVILGDPSTNAGVAPVDETAGLKVNLGSDNDVTVTGTVDLGATDNAVLDTIDAVLDTIKVDTEAIETAVEAIQAAQLTDGHNVTVDNSTGVAAVNIQDGGNTITVDGTVAVTNAGITTIAGAVTGTEMQVDVLTMPSVAVTNAALTELAAAINTDKLDVNIKSSDVASGGTAAADDADFTAGTTSGTPAQGVYESTPTSVTDGDLGTVGITSGRRLKTSATIDAALPAGTNAIGKLAANSGVDIGDVTIDNATLAVTQSGTWDEVGINDSGNSITVDNAQLSVVGTGTEAAAMRVTIASDSTGVLSVDDNGGAITVDGTVAVTGVSTLAEQQTQTTHLATIAGDTTSIQTAVEILDNAISGSEMQVDIVTIPDVTAVGKAADGAGVSGNPIRVAGSDGSTTRSLLTDSGGRLILGAGTNAFGKLAANSGVDIGDVDVTSLPALAAGTNAIGKVIPPDYDVTSHTAKAVKYYTSAGAATDGIIWSPAAGKRWHVATLFINISAAATVTIEDDLSGGDNPIMKMELAANSGIAIPFGNLYPLTSGEDAADLTITTTAGNVYVTAVGYEI